MPTPTTTIEYPHCITLITLISTRQALHAPPSLVLFYSTMATLEGKSLSETMDRVRHTLWPTLQVNWPFWAVVHTVTFSVVPLQ
jgi:hypothetical protein